MTDLATTEEQARVARVQALTARLEALADPEARAVGDELAEAIVDMYGDGLARIFAVLDGEDPALAGARAELAQDGVVASLMLMHGLYPVDLDTRVLEALEEVRPYLESHEGGVELLGVEEGIAHLRLLGSCNGCGASAATLESAVEDALREHAPDLLGISVEGVAPARNVTPGSADAREKAWVPLEGAAEIQRGHMVRVSAPPALLVANVAGTLLAYRDFCAGCPAPLSAGVLLGGTLTCAACGRAYDLPRAGRCKTDPELQLDPVPLLRGAEGVKVSVETAADAHESAGCELCPSGLSVDHRHLLNLDERRIVCVCETCWSVHSGDAEYRPSGSRTLWLDDFEMPEDVWADFDMPTGLAFLMRSSVTGSMIALYPSPAGATECELPLDAWDRLVARNPVLDRLEPDAEALVVNRLAKAGGGDGGLYVIVPIDQCYRLVGAIKESWEGISGGDAVDACVRAMFTTMRERAAAA
jgi:Fe-S cluster biogenesis protein NfuA/nitrite reductase/ring-hydroxylating ferredoxin subunit